MMDNHHLAKLSRPRTTRRAAGGSQEGKGTRGAPAEEVGEIVPIRVCVVIDRVFTRGEESRQPCCCT